MNNQIFSTLTLLLGIMQFSGCTPQAYRPSTHIGTNQSGVPNQDAEYARVDFLSLTNFDFDSQRSTLSDIPSSVRRFDGRRIKITGEMASLDEDRDAPTQKFALLPFDFQSDHPRIPQFILVCAADSSDEFKVTPGAVEVGGIFHVAILKYNDEVYALYRMEADYCKKAGK